MSVMKHYLALALLCTVGIVAARAADDPKTKPQPVATQQPAEAPTPAPAAQAPVERWEYRHSVAMSDGLPEDKEIMDAVGLKGWELVAVNVVPDRRTPANIWHYTYKRRVAPKP